VLFVYLTKLFTLKPFSTWLANIVVELLTAKTNALSIQFMKKLGKRGHDPVRRVESPREPQLFEDLLPGCGQERPQDP
jgi:hypothetical protein